MAKPKSYTVVHPKLHLSVNGRLQQVAAGSEIRLDPDAAEKLLKAGKIARKGKDAPVVEVGTSEVLDESQSTPAA